MRVALVVAVLPCLLIACESPSRERAPLEIEEVEVGGPVDAGLSTDDDEKGRPSSSGDDWILTGMLPESLPLHRPARLVGSGETPDGRSYFVFHTSTELEAVRSGLARRLPAAGWSSVPEGGGLTASKDGEVVDFVLSELEPGTEIRVVY